MGEAKKERLPEMIKMRYKDGQELGNSVGLLISILVRYPEIASIKFTHKNKILHMSFLLSSTIADDFYADFKENFQNSIAAYHMLENKSTIVNELLKTDCESITMLELSRDVETLSQGEISLTIAILREAFQNLLVTDISLDPTWEEDLDLQDELIECMLEDTKSDREERNLIGIREDGRVLVFNQDRQKPKN